MEKANERLVHARVIPNSKKELFFESMPSVFDIAVREKPERNLANTRVRELIARHFGVSVKAVSIRAGHRGPNKMLRVIMVQ